MKKILSNFSQFFLSLALFSSLICSNLLAQQNTGEIHGKVQDVQRGEPLIGANVILSGTIMGGNTDLEGNYSIKKVPEGQYTIIVRFVSYKQESRQISVKAGEIITFDFNLTPSAVQMNEVVVTGQGAAIEKRKLPATVETISLREIETTPANSIDVLLQGRIPGMLSLLPSGIPGTGARIQTRGIKSALSSSTPVIYVDGVRVDNGDNYRLEEGVGGQVTSSLADLVIGDIEKVEVIKGGAASTLYGSEAANGVIQIFTKRGLSGGVVPGAPKWRFGFTSGSDLPELKFTHEQITKDKFYRSSFYQGYKMNVVGGTELMSYNITGNMSENTGIVVKDQLKEKTYNLFTGLRAVLGERSDLQVSANYVRHDFGFQYNDNIIWSPLGQLEESAVFWPEYCDNPDSLLNLYLLPKITNNVNRFILTTNVNYSPFNAWTNKFTIGLDYRKNERRIFAPREAQDIVMQEGGFLHRNDREYLSLTLGFNSSYKLPTLGPLDQTVSLGIQGFRVEDRETYTNGDNFAMPGTEDLGNTAKVDCDESNRQLFNGGFFLQDQVGIFDRIFLDVGFRYDINSTFGKDIGAQAYPKAGIAYNISDETFYPDFLKPYLGSLKLRASIGQTGNFPPPFTRDKSYNAIRFKNEAGMNFGNPGDPTLKPEKTTSIDAGFDAGFWDDRISVEFNYFSQTTKDALFSVAMDPTTGFGAQQRNVGEITNKGVEVTLRANVINTSDFELELRASLATLENKVVSLGGNAGFTIGGFTFAPLRVEEGYPVGVWRCNVPILEADGTYKGNYTTNVLMGNPLPKQSGSFAIDMKIFKNLSINALAEFALGHYIQDVLTILRNLNGYPDAAAALPASTDPAKPYNFQTASSVWIQKANWIKVREISARYRLPDLLFNGINLTLSIRNPFIFGVKTAVDPEQSWNRSARGLEVGGIAGDVISAPKSIRLGIEINI
jgi:TonB-dependent SusC/RagA subfamily outer membrane receptor